MTVTLKSTSLQVVYSLGESLYSVGILCSQALFILDAPTQALKWTLVTHATHAQHVHKRPGKGHRPLAPSLHGALQYMWVTVKL